MDTTQAKNGIRKTKHVAEAAEDALEQVQETIQETRSDLRARAEHARDIVEDLRDRAELAFHERPYLLPVATGVVGLGIGVLIGSRVSRILLLTAAGALMSDTIRGQVAKIGREFVRDLGAKLGEG